MKDIMLADTPVEQREQILRDSCDQIVERSYTRKFDTWKIQCKLPPKTKRFCPLVLK